MNGVHDMGGMEGMGPIAYETNEPVFHADWEARVFAMNVAMSAWRKWNIDARRHAIEMIPAAEYLRLSYYEKWYVRLVDLMLQGEIVSAQELENGKAEGPRLTPPLKAGQVAAMLAKGSTAERHLGVPAQFREGQKVRARNMNPAGHTRLPRYARGKLGTIDRDHGVFVFPDTNAKFQGEKPQHVYAVRFTSQELWGPQASPLDAVYVDLWDDYLEPA